MKYARFGLILVGVIFVFSGCEKREEPDAPTLISPANGAVFDTLPLTLVWSSDEFAEGYVIAVQNDTTFSAHEIYAEPTDTVYNLTQDDFSNLANATYYWKAGAKWTDEEGSEQIAWSAYRHFIIQKSEPEPEDPTPPILISPADGSVLDTIPPTFTWSADTLSHGFLFRIRTDTTTEIDDSLEDTTWTMTREILDSLAEGTYSWAAATISNDGEEFWSETWTFTIERPEPITDLDTTYFPFGLGYEWCFERHEWGEGDCDEPWSHDVTYTYKITVVDSFWEGDTMVFELESSDNFMRMPYYFMPEYLWDMYWDGVKIWDDKILLNSGGWVNLIPDTFSDYWSSRKYIGDTLEMSSGFWDPHTSSDTYMKRLRGIGTIYQNYEYDFHTDIPPFCHEECNDEDRLLYFYNGQDTVYYASQSEAFGSSAKSCAARYRTSQAD